MVELRKRKAPEPAAAPPAKKSGGVKGAIAKAKSALTGNKEAPTNGAASSTSVAVGSTITLEGFGGEVETHDGHKVTLQKLVHESKGGVVLFTYPKASTPGCTTQACIFRDEYTPLSATGFSIYGLSTDSPKANTTFKEKQKLPYPLLCDPSASLIAAIGLKKAPKGTIRGVFVVDKDGKVLAAQPGSPAGTVEVVRKLVGASGSVSAPAADEDIGNIAEGSKVEKEIEEGKTNAQEVDQVATTNGATEQPAATNGTTEQKEDTVKADVAADVADTAEKLDAGAVA